MSGDDRVGRRAAALETRSVTPEPEQETIERLRQLLSHPATWALPTVLVPPGMPSEPAAAVATPDKPVLAEPVAAELAVAEPSEPDAADSADTPADSPVDSPADPPVSAPGEAADAAAAPSRAHPVSAARPRRRRPGRRALLLSAIAGAAAVVGLLVGLYLLPTIGLPGTSVQMALNGTGSTPDASADVLATKVDTGWKMTLDISDLPPAGEGAYYQGWVASPEQVVSLGTFNVTGSGEVELWCGVQVKNFRQVVITRQVIGGGQDPGEAVLAGDIPEVF